MKTQFEATFPPVHITSLIIDDNPISRVTIGHLANQIADLTVINEFSNAIDAYNFLQRTNVDLLFLDIEMPGINGLELTRNLKNKDMIIVFTTSKRDYAVEAFELAVADYLVKPLIPCRFVQAVDRARDILGGKKEVTNLINDEFLFVRESNSMCRLKIDDILYIEAMGDYVKFYTPQRLYAIYGTLKAAEEKLPAVKFVRVHRSYIVALNKIDTVKDGGLIINSKFLPVSDAHRRTLNNRMNIF